MTIDAEGKKRCARCTQEKLAEGNFYRIGRPGGDGFMGYCISCAKEKATAWNNATPEEREAAKRARAEEAASRKAAGVRVPRSRPNALQPDGTKRCTKCLEVKVAAGSFYSCTNPKKSADGFTARCIVCEQARLNAWKTANPERNAARITAWNVANIEKRREVVRRRRADPVKLAAEQARARELHAADPSKRAATRKRYNEAHPGRDLAHVRKYQAENPDKVLETQRKYRATQAGKIAHRQDSRMRAVGVRAGKISAEEWAQVLHNFDNACAYCRATGVDLEIEHLTPLKHPTTPGLHELGNVAPACRSCNARKGLKRLEEFMPERASEIRRLADLSRSAAQE